MAVFTYRGMDVAGKKVSGIIDAENLKSARLKLRKQNIYPTQVSEGSGTSSTANIFTATLQKIRKVKVEDIAMMTRQLSTLINANIPLVDALSAMVEQITNPRLKSAVTDIKERVKEGVRLADAMRTHSDIFSDLYINMIYAGEISGSLETILLRLADFTETQARLRRKVKGAMVYPMIMIIVGMLLLGLVLGFLIPKITKIFEKSKQALPLPTQIVMALSNLVVNYWYVIIILAALTYFLFKRYSATAKGRETIDRLKLKLFLFGPIFRMVAIARFSRTLSTLMKSGVQLMKGLDISKDVVENVVLSGSIAETRIAVKEGESIAGPLRRSKQFPPMVLHMIALGEKTGELEMMLSRIADTYEEQVDNKVAALMTALEPIIIVVMGISVGFIVLAVILPILKMNELV